MQPVKFNGLLKEFIETPKNVELSTFIQQRLNLEKYKANALSEKIESALGITEIRELTLKKRNSVATAKPNQTKRTADTFNIYSLDVLSGREFELFLKWLFEEMGFSVQLTKLVADSGVDLVLSKDNKKIAVQAKRYKRNIKVSNSTVLKTHGGRDIYGCDESLIVTTSYFTTQAIEDAKKLGIILWDRDDLSAKIDSINEKINSIRAKPVFPAFHLSLYKSLLSLHQFGGVFFIESKENGKYHIHRHGIRYPLVSFQARGLNKVTKCVLRMRGNKPVRENEGAVLIYSDSHYTYGREEVAYTKVIECLNQFL